MHIPRVIISGLSGGAGKTMLSLGLARALLHSGLRVKAFKKGPDYIDAAWLALAARSAQANLDPFFLPAPALRSLFYRGAAGHDISLIEGNRGIFDGLDLSGSCSTAELSRILQAPLLLLLDCTKMTRTAAALVSGCLQFETGLHIGGVVLNRTGNTRHQALARRAVEELAGVPVLGALPRRPSAFIVERHMGLAGLDECARADAQLDVLADFVRDHTDITAIIRLASSAPDLPMQESAPLSAGMVPEFCLDEHRTHAAEEALSAVAHNEPTREEACIRAQAPEPAAQASNPASASACSGHIEEERRLCIGYVRDAAFWFYYEENLSALREAGATLIPLSLLEAETPQGSRTGQNCRPEDWEHLDGIYIGGGQPELYAQALSDNFCCREHMASLSRKGLPIYAECGGFIYLSRELRIADVSFPMAGVFACPVEFHSRPQGLGYVEAEVVAPNPFHPLGTHFRGHEFHFSRCGIQKNTEASSFRQAAAPESAHQLAGGHILRLHRGRGMCSCPEQGGFDGLLFRNTFAAYTHVFAPALPYWARNFVSLCANWRQNPQRV
jgi:cobyrinic acid a,c-diamide synthase